MQDASSRFPTISKLLVLRQFLWGASFYGVYVLLTKYFLDKLNYNEADTIMMLGAFGAVGPVFAAIGGFVADRFIGSFRAVYMGYICYAVGFYVLGFGASSLNITLSIFAIAIIGYGRGLSATSPTVLFGNSYAKDNREAFQQGLTINYAVNNFGSFLVEYFFPFLLAYLGYSGDFILAGIIMSLCLLLFFIFRKPLARVGNELDLKPVAPKIWAFFALGSLLVLALVYWIFDNLAMGKYVLYVFGFAILIYFMYETFKASPEHKYKMIAVLIMTCVLICFYFYYGQMYTSMNMYTIKVADDKIFGFIPIKQESAVSFNTLWIFILGGPMIWIYDKLDKMGFRPSIPTKVGVAFIFTALAFLLLGLSTANVGSSGKVSMDWILWANFFQSISELIVGALAVGFIFEMCPVYLKAFAVGLKTVSLSLSGIFAAVIATKIALPKAEVLSVDVVGAVYGTYFYQLGAFALIMSLITLFISKYIASLVAKSQSFDK